MSDIVACIIIFGFLFICSFVFDWCPGAKIVFGVISGIFLFALWFHLWSKARRSKLKIK